MARVTGSRSYTPSMSDDAVRAKTGRVWSDWFRRLDRAGARTLDHKRIVACLLRLEPALGGWWSQMITVEYERARGLREKHQTTKGFQVSATRTIAAPLSELFEAWTDAARRRRWLSGTRIAIRSTRPRRTLRLAWDGGASSVEVRFAAKGRGKSQLTVDHTRLASRTAAARMKAYWKARLERLSGALEA